MHSFSLLDELVRELNLHVLYFLDDWHDIAALLLALPPLGLYVLRTQHTEYANEPLLSVAIALHCKQNVLSESLLRRYACDSRMSEGGCEWLSRAAAAAGRDFSIVCGFARGLQYAHTCRVGPNGLEALVQLDLRNGCKKFYEEFYEGEKDHERLVQCQFFEKGQERLEEIADFLKQQQASSPPAQ